jgi:hypothetical protein
MPRRARCPDALDALDKEERDHAYYQLDLTNAREKA